MSHMMSKNGKLFFPSVGPGYNDTLIRPWNHEHTKEREGGKYYDRMWAEALAAAPAAITITSYNEWGACTAIACMQIGPSPLLIARAVPVSVRPPLPPGSLPLIVRFPRE